MSATVDITSAEHRAVLAIPFASVVMRGYDLDSLESARRDEAADDTGSLEVQAAENQADEAEVEEEAEEAAEEDEPAVKDEEEKREDIKGVFVIRDGVARFVQIETGIAGQKNIEVVSGLEEADSVISGPYAVLRTIKDGDPVNITGDNNGNGDEDS